MLLIGCRMDGWTRSLFALRTPTRGTGSAFIARSLCVPLLGDGPRPRPRHPRSHCVPLPMPEPRALPGLAPLVAVALHPPVAAPVEDRATDGR
jgi:hypothetical protein